MPSCTLGTRTLEETDGMMPNGLCGSCGNAAPTFKDGKYRKYCLSCASKVCRCGGSKAWATRHCLRCETRRRSEAPPILHTSECSWCGNTDQIALARLNQGQQFCSKSCAASAKAALRADYSKPSSKRPACAVYFLTCRYCGSQFVARNRQSQLCSDICKRMEHWKPERKCKVCLGYFPTEYGNKTRFCSLKCRETAQAHWQVAPRLRKHHLRNRSERAIHFGVDYEFIDLAKVLERDGWICGICHTAISPKARYPDQLSPSLDHVIPISKGGAHLYSNVQAAHLSCNVIKGVRLPSPEHLSNAS